MPQAYGPIDQPNKNPENAWSLHHKLNIGEVASFWNSFICGRYKIVTDLTKPKMFANTKIEIMFALLLVQASNCLESFSGPRLEELRRNPDKSVVIAHI